MTDKEIQASDEEMERFNISQDEKCVSVEKEKLNDLMNKISFALKDATLAQGFEIICKRIAELEKENEELKKNALVWHKVTCFDKPDENGFITNDCPGDIGEEFLVRSKFGDCSIRELVEVDNGVIFEDCEWEDVDEWAELP